MRDDLSHVLLLFRLRWLPRDVLPDALVGSGVIEVGLILLHCLMEMALAQYEVVQLGSLLAVRTNSARSRQVVGCFTCRCNTMSC